VVNAVGDGKRVAFNVDKVLRGEPLQERMVSIDVITESRADEHDVFPEIPARAADDAPTGQSAAARRTKSFRRTAKNRQWKRPPRCFSCGTCNACDNCYLVCPEPCIIRYDRSNGLYKILVDYCKGCRVCIEECPTGCLEGVPELDFDTGVVRMDTAFAITQGCTVGRRRNFGACRITRRKTLRTGMKRSTTGDAEDTEEQTYRI